MSIVIYEKEISRIVLASSNKGKLQELQDLLSPMGVDVITQESLGVVDAEETGLSFIENAIIKARNAVKQSGLPAIADDSGLMVSHLNGAPGIYSARFAGDYGNDYKNNQKLLKEMQGVTDRDASFVCSLAICISEKHPLPIIAEGQWNGEISESLSGEKGFGYDPIFYIKELGKTSAEITKLEKNKISHRAKALANLKFKIDNIKYRC